MCKYPFEKVFGPWPQFLDFILINVLFCVVALSLILGIALIQSKQNTRDKNSKCSSEVT